MFLKSESITKPKLAVYLRVSGVSQKKEETVLRQEANFENCWPSLSQNYSLVERYPGVRYFSDEAYNLETLKPETALSDLLGRCERGEVHAIFISEMDRLLRSRSAKLRGSITDLVNQCGVQIITKNGPASRDIVLLEIQSAMGAEDKRAMLKKCHEAKITRARNEGRPPTGRQPYGFRRLKKEMRWETVEDEVKIIRIAMGLAIGKAVKEMPPGLKAYLRPEGLNDTEVANVLTRFGFSKMSFYQREGLSHVAKMEFTRAAVETIFRDDRYCGTLTYTFKPINAVGNPYARDIEDIEVPVVVPRIFSDEEWSELCRVRSARRRWSTRNQKHDYLAQGLIRCAECGVSLAARPKWHTRFVKSKDEKVTYPPILHYTCARKLKVSGFRCSSKTHHPVTVIDDLIWAQVKSLVLEPETLRRFEGINQGPLLDIRLIEVEKLACELQRRLDGLANERKNIVTLAAKGLVTDEDLARDLARITNEQKEIEREKQKFDTEATALKAQIDSRKAVDLTPIREQILNRADTLSFDEMAKITRAILKCVTISADGQMDLEIHRLVWAAN